MILVGITAFANKDKFLLQKDEWVHRAYEEMATGEIIGLLNSSEAREDKERILYNLKNIDWTQYEKIGNPRKLLDWLREISPDDQYALINILKMADTNLDGVYAEGYSDIVGQLFLKDMKTFVKSAAELPPELVDKVCGFLQYNLSYQETLRPIIKEQMQELLDQDLSEKEREVLKKIEKVLGIN